MCIRDSFQVDRRHAERADGGGREVDHQRALGVDLARVFGCLLYTSDAADDLLCVDLGGSRIIKKKKEK